MMKSTLVMNAASERLHGGRRLSKSELKAFSKLPVGDALVPQDRAPGPVTANLDVAMFLGLEPRYRNVLVQRSGTASRSLTLDLRDVAVRDALVSTLRSSEQSGDASAEAVERVASSVETTAPGLSVSVTVPPKRNLYTMVRACFFVIFNSCTSVAVPDSTPLLCSMNNKKGGSHGELFAFFDSRPCSRRYHHR